MEFDKHIVFAIVKLLFEHIISGKVEFSTAKY